jgi:hypothetical protein
VTDAEDIWPAPKYHVGKPKHLHAIGVISMNYNAFERNLYWLYRFHLDRKKIPQKLSDLYYLSSMKSKNLVPSGLYLMTMRKIER